MCLIEFRQDSLQTEQAGLDRLIQRYSCSEPSRGLTSATLVGRKPACRSCHLHNRFALTASATVRSDRFLVAFVRRLNSEKRRTHIRLTTVCQLDYAHSITIQVQQLTEKWKRLGVVSLSVSMDNRVDSG